MRRQNLDGNSETLRALAHRRSPHSAEFMLGFSRTNTPNPGSNKSMDSDAPIGGERVAFRDVHTAGYLRGRSQSVCMPYTHTPLQRRIIGTAGTLTPSQPSNAVHIWPRALFACVLACDTCALYVCTCMLAVYVCLLSFIRKRQEYGKAFVCFDTCGGDAKQHHKITVSRG